MSVMETFFIQVYPTSSVKNVYEYKAFLPMIQFTCKMIQYILIREFQID
jgi:hypothetical protein